MLWIKKFPIPPSLVLFKQSGGRYSDLDKKEVRGSLLREQKYLCAYCCCSLNERNVQIEHWIPQSAFNGRELELDYSNLLVVCIDKFNSCDTSKREKIISINPLVEHHIIKLYYHSGRINSRDVIHDNEINSVLNLNDKNLVMNRVRVLSQFRLSLAKNFPNNTKADFNKLFRHYSEVNPLPAYANVILNYLQKKIS